MSLQPMDPSAVYRRGLEDAGALSVDERFVFGLIELETLADMEGWDDFFTHQRTLDLLPAMREGLKQADDEASLRVLDDYQAWLEQHGIEMNAASIETFVLESAAGQEPLQDFRQDFATASEERWRRVAAYLRQKGVELDAAPDVRVS